MKTKQAKTNEAFDTSRLDFLMSVDKLLRTAEETKRLRDQLLEQSKQSREVSANE